jgi:ABC-type transport system involved in multi-copper enzyme maturation permease subunit
VTRGGPLGALLAGSYAVLERDFLVATSRRRFLVLRFLGVAVVAALVGLWPAVVGDLGLAAQSPSVVGRQVFGVAAFSLPLLLMFVAPAVGAPAIVTERTLRTLPIVLTTPVRPLTFLLAKFASRVGMVMVLVLGAMPSAAVCFLYGGVSFTQFLDLVLLCTGIAVFSVGVGIAVSTYAGKTATAVLATYGWTVFGQLLLIAFLGWATSQRGGVSLEDLQWLTPMLQWIALLNGNAPGTETSLLFTGVMCGVAVFSLFLASLRLAREGGPADEKKKRGRRCRRARFPNPVMDRALRGTLLHGPRRGAFVMLVVVLLANGTALLLGASENDLDDAWPYALGMLTTTAVLAFSALAQGAHAVASERQTGALDLLMATRMRLDEVARGKAAGIAVATLPYLAVPLAMAALASLGGSELEAFTVVSWLGSSVCVVVLFGAIGLWFSARTATPGRATLRAFAFTVGAMVLHVIVVVLSLMALFRMIDDDNPILWIIMEVSPAFSLITTFVAGQEWAGDGFDLDSEALAWCVGWAYMLLYLTLAWRIVRSLPSRIRENLEREGG